MYNFLSLSLPLHNDKTMEPLNLPVEFDIFVVQNFNVRSNNEQNYYEVEKKKGEMITHTQLLILCRKRERLFGIRIRYGHSEYSTSGLMK